MGRRVLISESWYKPGLLSPKGLSGKVSVDLASSRWADSQEENLMMSHLGSPMFMAGEVLLGLSITVLIGAFIATVEDTYRSHQR